MAREPKSTGNLVYDTLKNANQLLKKFITYNYSAEYNVFYGKSSEGIQFLLQDESTSLLSSYPDFTINDGKEFFNFMKNCKLFKYSKSEHSFVNENHEYFKLGIPDYKLSDDFLLLQTANRDDEEYVIEGDNAILMSSDQIIKKLGVTIDHIKSVVKENKEETSHSLLFINFSNDQRKIIIEPSKTDIDVKQPFLFLDHRLLQPIKCLKADTPHFRLYFFDNYNKVLIDYGNQKTNMMLFASGLFKC